MDLSSSGFQWSGRTKENTSQATRNKKQPHPIARIYEKLHAAKKGSSRPVQHTRWCFEKERYWWVLNILPLLYLELWWVRFLFFLMKQVLATLIPTPDLEPQLRKFYMNLWKTCFHCDFQYLPGTHPSAQTQHISLVLFIFRGNLWPLCKELDSAWRELLPF